MQRPLDSVFTCPVCHEGFSVTVWHCPVCHHHWDFGRDECWNCHESKLVGNVGVVRARDDEGEP